MLYEVITRLFTRTNHDTKEVNAIMDDKKVKITFRMDEETNRMIKAVYQQDNCNSQNEFIEKAIRFYVSYITTDKNSEFLNPAIYHAIV